MRATAKKRRRPAVVEAMGNLSSAVVFRYSDASLQALRDYAVATLILAHTEMAARDMDAPPLAIPGSAEMKRLLIWAEGDPAVAPPLTWSAPVCKELAPFAQDAHEARKRLTG
jgi:hypothetical protein